MAKETDEVSLIFRNHQLHSGRLGDLSDMRIVNAPPNDFIPDGELKEILSPRSGQLVNLETSE